MTTYTYDDIRGFRDVVEATCEDVRRDNPIAWRNAHNGAFDRESRRYNDLCVQRLRARGIFCGLNGKRGDPSNRSDDILNFGLYAGQGGARDTSGVFPAIAIIDFIVGAGDGSAHIGWIDQSAKGPGYFLDPENLPADSQSTPAPSRPEETKPYVPTPPAGGPGPVTDLAVIKAQMAAMHEVLQVVIAGQATLGGAVENVLHDLHHLVGHEIVPHIGDVKHLIVGEQRAERFR